MKVCDYSRSFVTFVVPGNNARISVEARCVLQRPDGTTEQFLMFASCKSETVYVEKDLFTSDNYDFSGIFSPEQYSIARIHINSEKDLLETGFIAERFVEVRRHVVEVEQATLLQNKSDIIAATLAHRVLVARTEINNEATGLKAVLEFPVKTMNVDPERGLFQVDTGPIPYYDFTDPNPDIMQRFRWAYCAFNEFAGAYFIFRVPTPIVRSGVEVARYAHYSQIVHCPHTRNTLWAFD